MNITFRQLRLFLALAETGSVSGAAKLMHVTQPTASMQLKDITESVGLPLYEVISKKSTSQTWEKSWQQLRVIAQSWDSFEQNADAVKDFHGAN